MDFVQRHNKKASYYLIGEWEKLMYQRDNTQHLTIFATCNDANCHHKEGAHLTDAVYQHTLLARLPAQAAETIPFPLSLSSNGQEGSLKKMVIFRLLVCVYSQEGEIRSILALNPSIILKILRKMGWQMGSA